MSNVLKRFSTAKSVIKNLMLDRGETDVNNYQKYMSYFNRAFKKLQLDGYIPNLKRTLLKVKSDKTVDLPEDYLQYYTVGPWIEGLNEVVPLTKNRELTPKPSASVSDEDCTCSDCGCSDSLANAVKYPTTTTEDVVMTVNAEGPPRCNYEMIFTWLQDMCTYTFNFAEPFGGVYPFNMVFNKNGVDVLDQTVNNAGEIDAAFVAAGFTVLGAFNYEIVDSFDEWASVRFYNDVQTTLPATTTKLFQTAHYDNAFAEPFSFDGISIELNGVVLTDNDTYTTREQVLQFLNWAEGLTVFSPNGGDSIFARINSNVPAYLGDLIIDTLGTPVVVPPTVNTSVTSSAVFDISAATFPMLNAIIRIDGVDITSPGVINDATELVSFINNPSTLTFGHATLSGTDILMQHYTGIVNLNAYIYPLTAIYVINDGVTYNGPAGLANKFEVCEWLNSLVFPGEAEFGSDFYDGFTDVLSHSCGNITTLHAEWTLGGSSTQSFNSLIFGESLNYIEYLKGVNTVTIEENSVVSACTTGPTPTATFPLTITNLVIGSEDNIGVTVIQDEAELTEYFVALGFTQDEQYVYSIEGTSDIYNMIQILDWDGDPFNLLFTQTGCVCDLLPQVFKKTISVYTSPSGQITKEETLPIINSQYGATQVNNAYLDLTYFNQHSHDALFPYAFTTFSITELFYNGVSHVVDELITSYAELRTYLESLGFVYVNDNLYTITGTDVVWGYLYTGKIDFNVSNFLTDCKDWSVDYVKTTTTICPVEVKDCGCIEVTTDVVEACNSCGVRSLWWWWDRYYGTYALYSQVHRRGLNLNSNPYGYFNVLENEGNRGLIILNSDFLYPEVVLVYQARIDVTDFDFMIPVQAEEMFISFIHAKSIEKRADISLYERREAERLFKRDAAEARRLINPLRLYELLDQFRTNPTG